MTTLTESEERLVEALRTLPPDTADQVITQGQRISLGLGKRGGESVHLQYEAVGLLPDQQILKRPGWFGNGHT